MARNTLDFLRDYMRLKVDVEVVCRNCQHRRVFMAAQLAKWTTDRLHPRFIKYRCGTCRSDAVDVRPHGGEEGLK